MSCQHHHNDHHHHHHQSNLSSCCCCGGGGIGSGFCSSIPSAATLAGSSGNLTEPLLRALSSQLQLASNHSPSNDQLLQTIAYQLLLQPNSLAKQPQTLPPPPQPISDRNPRHLQTESVLKSLLRRVSALESHLPNISTSFPSFPTETLTPRESLRDHASRLIQTRFRSFLVRRSQILRDLKRLAAVKSRASDIRSSLSGRTHHPADDLLPQKAMDLLLLLDSIQSRDPMIREGKSSISRELSRILDFLDRTSSQRHLQVDKSSSAAEVPPKPSRRVTFSLESEVVAGDSQKFSTVLRDSENRFFDESRFGPMDAVGDDELTGGGGSAVGDGGFAEVIRKSQVQNRDSGLSAPAPVHMERIRSSNI